MEARTAFQVVRMFRFLSYNEQVCDKSATRGVKIRRGAGIDHVTEDLRFRVVWQCHKDLAD
jgi:hypothetical protein